MYWRLTSQAALLGKPICLVAFQLRLHVSCACQRRCDWRYVEAPVMTTLRWLSQHFNNLRQRWRHWRHIQNFWMLQRWRHRDIKRCMPKLRHISTFTCYLQRLQIIDFLLHHCLLTRVMKSGLLVAVQRSSHVKHGDRNEHTRNECGSNFPTIHLKRNHEV